MTRHCFNCKKFEECYEDMLDLKNEECHGGADEKFCDGWVDADAT